MTETLDAVLRGLIYLAATFVIFYVGKRGYDLRYPGVRLRDALFQDDNVALGVAVVGYYAGLVLALGGILQGASVGLLYDLIDIGIYGLLAVVLVLISAWINDRVILRHFRNRKEIFDDRNVGTGAVEAGNHIANGLLIAGAISGEGGGIGTALAFWGLGQIGLVVAGLLYTRMLGYDLHGEIERDNVAAGVAFAGVLIAIGNVVRLGTVGDFISWADNLTVYGLYLVAGLVLLPVTRFVTDLVLVPGAKLTEELAHQEHPNLGAGFLEAFSYIAASMLIGWTI
ncbi:MAG: DUF350 domain-containing protein [Acidobacteriota bacterium]